MAFDKLRPVTKQELLKRQVKGSELGVPTNRAFRAVAVAQLVERSLPTPEIHSSNPDIGIILSTNCAIEKTKIKKRRPIFKK